MRTPTCLISILVLAAVTPSLPAADGGASRKPEASAVVRITVDTDILPLNPETLEALVFSSAVAGKALRDTLGDLKPDDQMLRELREIYGSEFLEQMKSSLQGLAPQETREFIRIEWLSQDCRPRDTRADRVSSGEWPPPQTPAPMDTRPTPSKTPKEPNANDEMYREMEKVYGADYVRQFREMSAEREKKQNASPSDRPSPPGAGSRSEGRTGGGMMGAMGMGGMGGRMWSSPYGEASGGGRGGMGMGGYGGGMMGGGMGMGPYGGGMIGGMGPYGGGMIGGMGPYGGGMYGGLPSTMPSTGALQTATVRLSVRLPANLKPAARTTLLKAVIENLRASLRQAYENYEGQLAAALREQEARRDAAQKRLEEALGARPDRTNEGAQLDVALNTIVDLSALSPQMPFSAAIEALRQAVQPPLPIVVLWKELLDSDIEPTTPIGMDGLPSVKLETALRMLIAAVSGGQSDISYQIDDHVIVIREEELQPPQAIPAEPIPEAEIRDLAVGQRELAHRLQQLEMDLATAEARREAIKKQIAQVRTEAATRLADDPVTREMQNLIEMSEKHLETLTKQVEAGRLTPDELARAKESLTRAKIELARRREELGRSAGGGQFAELNSELSRTAIDVAAKQAEAEVIRLQLMHMADRLARASIFDPKAARIRIIKEALDVAETRVAKLQARLAGLQPPTVTMIGTN